MLAVADETSKFSLICGYCLLPTNAEASVTIGDSEIPLCNDTDITCYELVTVYGRPLADGRRVGRWTKTRSQMELPFEDLPTAQSDCPFPNLHADCPSVGKSGIPYMMENTPEEFERVVQLAWGDKVPDGPH